MRRPGLRPEDMAPSKKHQIPPIHCKQGQRKHEIAEKYLPEDPDFVGGVPDLGWPSACSRLESPALEERKDCQH
jgi:hypothetical protein